VKSSAFSLLESPDKLMVLHEV
jgi:hypothetical protein